MEYKVGDKVNIVIGKFTPMGIRVFIDGEYPGMLYKNEVFRRVRQGQRLEAYIKEVREDGYFDVQLQPIKFIDNLKMNKEKVLEKLEENNGVIDLGDKSDAGDIKYVFQMSKKGFKAACGSLMKDKKIRIEPQKISLIQS